MCTAQVNAMRAGMVAAVLTSMLWQSPRMKAQPRASLADKEKVGRAADGRIITPVNQVLTPYGRNVELPGVRPQAVALSPNGKLLVTAGNVHELIVIDPVAGVVRQRVPLPTTDPKAGRPSPVSERLLHPDREDKFSFNGLIFSPSGDRVYMSNVDGPINVFSISPDGNIRPFASWLLPAAGAPRRAAEIPSGLAVSADGTKLYVCGNLSNRLLELDARTGNMLRTFDVGVAPYDVILSGAKAYVSNWGGRRPGPQDITGPAGRGTSVRVDPIRLIANEGSVTVVDLDKSKVQKELLTGLHASGLAKSSAHTFVVCCNAASDNLSVIDTRSDAVVATLWAKPNAADLLGAAPNAAAFDASGRRLFVANGSQNAIAVLDFNAEAPHRSRLLGMIPVGWYPGAVLVDDKRSVIVAANLKGLPKTPEKSEKRGPTGFNSHQHFGSVSLVPIPTDKQLPALSERVARNLRAPRIVQALLPARPDQPPRAIPERIGEPSRIKHVVYIIKENRTYDQVFGALGRGNGDASLCVFGREVTPNHHKIAEQFVLLDNTYCCGILSADGHQWSTTAYSTDYVEKSFPSFARSYPDGMGEDEVDGLAYSPAGFIWDGVRKQGKTLRNYGEFMTPAVRWRDAAKTGIPDFLACYGAWKNGTNDVIFESKASVESIRTFSSPNYVGWELTVPDQYRADFILRELADFEMKKEFPNFVLILLPQDHTNGTKPGSPTPAACMADHDLALGRIVGGLSHSRFWPEMAIFAIEDDPQDGWDHVSGYRTVAFCASPYAKRGAVVSVQYNTTSILRTIEQILGLRPMNQFDASATPMFECFREKPDYSAYTAAPSLIALDKMNPPTSAITDPVQRQDAIVSASLNFREVDGAPEDVLNRILWRAMRGSHAAYPEWAITGDDDTKD